MCAPQAAVGEVARGVVDDEERDEDVLDREEEVLPVCREGECIPERVGRRYCVCDRFERECGQGEASGGVRVEDCIFWILHGGVSVLNILFYFKKRVFRANALRSSCGSFIIDPPMTSPIPRAFENAYLKHFES